MCVFVFSISTPSGNICMSVRGCKVADRTALIHQLKHTYTHTHLLSPSTIHTHIHMPLFGHTQKWSSHNFSYLHLVCILYPSCSISFITQTRTHTRALLARLAGLKRGSVLDIPGIERPCFPCFPGNRPATNTPSEHHPVYRAECVCVQGYKANAEISTRYIT